MNPSNIEFATPTAEFEITTTPWETPKQGVYQDLLLKPGFSERRFKFPTGATWFRIVPALQGSRGWMLGLHALNHAGRHAHPRMLNPKAKSVFDLAYGWCKTNLPDHLYSKANRNGFRLLTDPVCLFWILIEQDGKMVARLVLASGYDGSRGGTSGLGHQIWKLTQERDEHGKLVANPVDPAEGVQICIDKTQTAGSRYPSYSLRVGRVPAPIGDFLARMEPDELAALQPLEQTVYLPDEEEEWKLLERVIDPETVARIRADQF